MSMLFLLAKDSLNKLVDVYCIYDSQSHKLNGNEFCCTFTSQAIVCKTFTIAPVVLIVGMSVSSMVVVILAVSVLFTVISCCYLTKKRNKSEKIY